MDQPSRETFFASPGSFRLEARFIPAMEGTLRSEGTLTKDITMPLWVYTVKRHEHLLGIVRREFQLREKSDSAEVDRIIRLIVVQNPHITRDTIRPNDVLTLRF